MAQKSDNERYSQVDPANQKDCEREVRQLILESHFKYKDSDRRQEQDCFHCNAGSRDDWLTFNFKEAKVENCIDLCFLGWVLFHDHLVRRLRVEGLHHGCLVDKLGSELSHQKEQED